MTGDSLLDLPPGTGRERLAGWAAERGLPRYRVEQMARRLWVAPVERWGAATELPLVVAVRNDRPAHAELEISSTDGTRHRVEVSAFPIQTAHGSRGAIAVLWPAEADAANGVGA